MTGFVRRLLALAGLGACAAVLVPVAPAQAASRVTVDGGGQGAVIDGTYSTQLTVSGTGFQSVKGGHGGIYVWFGTVGQGWRPSQGGVSGVDYAYVPDTEDKSNKGFQQFVSFPGSDTASSAADAMSADGRWSVRLTVPGPKFQAVGRNGSVRTVDCRRVTCGVITVGAHGVRNANNETFTPVRVGDLHSQPETAPAEQGGQQPQEAGVQEQSQSQSQSAPQAAPVVAAPARRIKGPVRLKVDRKSAVAGRVLSWSARNLPAGRQFTVVVDDGLAASGPHVAGNTGVASGVLTLPADLPAGTHELRLFGAGKSGSIRFGTSAEVADTSTSLASAESAEPATNRDAAPLAFMGVAAFAFALALGFAVRRSLGGRRA